MNKISILIFVCSITLSSCSTIKRQYNFNELIARQSGKKIFLKSGEFKLSTTIELSSGMELIGDGTTLLFDQESLEQAILITNSENITIKGISFTSAELVSNESHAYLKKCNYKHAITLQNVTKVKIQGCDFKNLIGTAIKVLNGENLLFKGCNFRNIGLKSFRGVPYSYDGIYLGGNLGVKDIVIDSCSFTNIGSTFIPQDRHNDGDGIQVLTKGFANNLLIKNSTFEKCSARGIKIQSGKNILVDNNIFIEGGAAVLVPMLKQVQDITISNNKVFSNKIAFGTNKAGDSADAININILNNEVDSCVHFFRTSGKSSIRNSSISNNIISNVEQFVISGRFFNTQIDNNDIDGFAIANHKSWKMAILLSPESDNVIIENNNFGKVRRGAVILDNRSKNRIVFRSNKNNK